jgi:hypothetical protein
MPTPRLCSKISFIQVKKLSLTTNNTASYLLHSPTTHQQRLECFCHYRINPNNPSHFATFPGNVRGYIGELFKAWQCPSRQIIHAYFWCYRSGLLLCQTPCFRRNTLLLLSHYLSRTTLAVHQTRLLKKLFSPCFKLWYQRFICTLCATKRFY